MVRLNANPHEVSSAAPEAATPLATILDRQGRRLAWVAARLGVDASTVSRWRSGDRALPAARRTQLAAILEVDPIELAGFADAGPPPTSADGATA